MSNCFGKVSVGGLLWDANGEWISRFLANLSYCGVLVAKAWGVLYGLCMEWDMGHRSIILKMGNECLTSIILS